MPPSFELFHILRLHMPDQLILISDRKVQSRITEDNADIEFRLAVLLLGDGALEALLQPQLAAIGAVIHGAERIHGCCARGKASVMLCSEPELGKGGGGGVLPLVFRVGGLASSL